MTTDLQRIVDQLESVHPFILCSFPDSEQIECFEWKNGEFVGKNGRRFIVQGWDSSEHAERDHIASRGEHMDIVQKAIDSIRAGQFEKVVLSRIREEKLAKGGDAQTAALFVRLISLYPKTLRYLMRHPIEGLWMGATPETLLRREGEQYSTMALAGTRPNRNEGESFNWQEKEMHEHEVVVMDIVQRLKPFGEAEVSPVSTLIAGPVAHLLTRIDFISEAAVMEVAKALHPTPAVCGWPLFESFQFIEKEEPHSRGLYTGFLGVLQPDGNANLFVNLRCMRIEADRYLLYVGGGITGASAPEAEWEETENKAMTLLRAID